MNTLRLIWFIASFSWVAASIAAGRAEQHPLATPAIVIGGRAPAIGRPPASTRLGVTIALPLRDAEALTNLLRQIYDPASPQFHRYLGSAEFASRFGPSEADYQSVIAFAKLNGLAVTGLHPNRTLVDVAGSVADIERVFHLTMRIYGHPKENRNYYAPDSPPSLDLATPILSIGGLDNFNPPRPMNLVASPAKTPSGAALATTGSGPRGRFIGNDFRTAYAPGVSLDGAGQSVGLFELDDFYPGDIATYEALAGLRPVPLATVRLNGLAGPPGGQNIEVALDIDMVVSMAPGLAQVIVYEGVSPNDVLNRMATDNQARQLSSSWGFGTQTDPVRDQIFLQFAAQGQSMFQASGDFGAYAGGVFPPSDDPNITVVGGTALTTTGPGGSWLSESAWPEGGGGVSAVFPLPEWQQGAATAANQGSTALRNIPDVACLADQSIWLVANNGEEATIGGTSAAAPLWVGFAALVNERAALENKPAPGFLNPALYAIGRSTSYTNCFHDIATGADTNSASPSRFFAVPGYDLCTGWGSPTGSNLIAALLAPPEPLQISPADGLAASGPAQGPFSPSAQFFALDNTSTSSLQWSLANTSAWLTALPSSGSLAPGDPPAAVTLGFAPGAANLPAGAYSAMIWFTNLGDGYVQTRSFSLAVVSPPAITAGPSDQTIPAGSVARFSVTTATNASLAYQWRRGKTNLADNSKTSGCASSELVIGQASAADNGSYSVIVSNILGVATSAAARLTVTSSPPVIIQPPDSQAAAPGATVTFAVAAAGDAPLGYQWRKDGADLPAARSSDLVLTNVSATDAGVYQVVVSNALGVALSDPASLIVASITAPGVTLATIYSFTGAADGTSPNGLFLALDGNFYGTTGGGGAFGLGSIFKMTAAGEVANLRSFAGGPDGATPGGALAQGVDGYLYGATLEGGDASEGVYFRTSLDGDATILISLGATNGLLPYAGLSPAADGSFYGVTYEGGDTGYGTFFKLSPAGGLKTLYSFTGGADGGLPFAVLTPGPDGRFYGTTFAGGASGVGAIFSVTTNGTMATIASFSVTNGANPCSGLAPGDDGSFYGTTAYGGKAGLGAVFRATAAGGLTNLYSFKAGAGGANPLSGLIQSADGNFYGTTANGGLFGYGTIFSVSPDGATTTLAQFDGFNGATPRSALAQGPDGSLYGTTQSGGDSGDGAIFRLSVDSAPKITSQPASQTAFLGARVVLSVAVFGGPPLYFQWQRNGTNLADTPMISGSTARALVLSNAGPNDAGTYSVTISNFLGSAQSTGAILAVTSSPPRFVLQPTNLVVRPGATVVFSAGAVGNPPLGYQWRRNGNPLADAGNLSGSTASSLAIRNATEANNGVYDVIATNTAGSTASASASLAVTPASAAGTSLATIHSLASTTEGRRPNGLVLGPNGALYGTTQLGGAGRAGTVLELDTNGAATTLVSFGGSSGGEPTAGLAPGADGNFYGTTSVGGPNQSGNIFRVSPEGAFANLYSFTGGGDGGTPTASLSPGTNGSLFGVTADGGDFGAGNIFAVSLDGALTNVYSFTGGADGASPSDPPVLAPDGNLYGTSASASGYGAIYRLSPSGVIATLYEFTGGTDGYNPNGLILGDDGNLYGTAANSSVTINGMTFPQNGTAFRLTPGGAFTTLVSFDYIHGAQPRAALTEGPDGNLYGTTFTGGAFSDGVIFRLSPSGTLTLLASLDGFDTGANPAAPLTVAPDGGFYGTARNGGANGDGAIFQLRFTSAPSFTTEPSNQIAYAGRRATLRAAVFGAPPLYYQWSKNGTNLVDGGAFHGAASRVLTIDPIALAEAGLYSLTVSNTLGLATSSAALLTVEPPPPPVLSATQTGVTINITWSAIPGLVYQLQQTASLSPPLWTNLGTPILATNPAISVQDFSSPAPGRFFRVLLLP